MYSESIAYRQKLQNNAIQTANKIVPKIIKNDTEWIDLSIKRGFEDDAAVFMDTLNTKVSKLTTHKQQQFFKNLTSALKLEKPDFFNKLSERVELLTQYRNRAEHLDKFNNAYKNLFELAEKRGFNLKKLIIR